LERELPLRLQHELGSRLREGLDHAHAESGANGGTGLKLHESLERLRCVVVTQLAEVVLAQVAVDAVLVGPRAELGEVIANGLRPAEVAEAQADDAVTYRPTRRSVVLLVLLIES